MAKKEQQQEEPKAVVGYYMPFDETEDIMKLQNTQVKVYGETNGLIPIRKKKKVAIIGFAKSWVQAPWDDEEFEIWCLNEFYHFGEKMTNFRYDRWFEIHNPMSPSKNTERHHNFLKSVTCPLYMQEQFNEFPASIRFPREDVKEYFNENFIIDDIGAPFTDFSNQVSWMTALAIMEGFEEIHIYGVDMATESEYQFQRSSCQFFIGYAAGKGIKFLIPRDSELCKFPQDYGFDTDNQSRIWIKNRNMEHKKHIDILQQERKKIQNRTNQIDQECIARQGAMQENNYLLSNHLV